MKAVFEELVELYCRTHAYAWEDEDIGDEYGDANADAFSVLEEAIVKLHAPKTIGDVMILPPEGQLRNEGLIYLIERDASGAYDQIEGYVDVVIWDGVSEAITPSQYGFDGLQLCNWIDQEFPVGERL